MKKVLALTIVILLAALAFGQSDSNKTISSFDINKVRQALGAVDSGSAVTAVTAAVPAAAPKRTPVNVTLVILRIVGWLALFTLVFVGLAWGIKKLGLAGKSKLGGGGAMDLLEVLPLGQNRSVMLVRILDKVYAVGQTPQAINLLTAFDETTSVKLITSAKSVSLTQFKDAFAHFMGKLQK